MKKARIEEIQVLRGLAFLAVVMQHAIAHYAYVPEQTLGDGVLLAVMLLAVKFAVPLFIFITGLVLFYNYNRPLNYVDFVQKRLKDIIVPYLVWTVVYWLSNYGLEANVWDTIKQLILVAFTGKASYHLWYVVMIFQSYLLFPVFRSILAAVRPLFTTGWSVYAGLVLVAGAYIYLTTWVWPINVAMEKANVPLLTPMFTTYADRNFLYFFYYFVLGAVAGLYIEQWRAWVSKYQTAIGGFFVVMFGYFLYRVTSSYQTTPTFKVNLDATFLIRPVMAVFLIASMPAVYGLAMRMARRATETTNKIYAVLGDYSYGAYLCHALVLNLAVPLTDAIVPFANPAVRTVLSFALCSVLSIGLAALIARTPVGKWVVGIRKKPQTQ